MPRINACTDDKGHYSALYDPKEQIYRNVHSQDKLWTSFFDGKLKGLSFLSMAHLVDYFCDFYGDQDLFGVRDLIKVHQVDLSSTVVKNNEGKDGDDDGKKKEVVVKMMFKYELSDYRWMSYRTVKECVGRMEMELKEMGVEKGDNLLIFAGSCPEWLMTAYACYSLSILVGTAYDAMKPNQVYDILKELEPKVILVDSATLPILNKLLEQYPQEISRQLSTLILIGSEGQPQHDEQVINKTRQLSEKGFKIRFSDPIFFPSQPSTVQYQRTHTLPGLKDIAMVVYTSGSTGKPKGAMLSHRAILSMMYHGASMRTEYFKDPSTYLAYLPLAHVLDIGMLNVMVCRATRVGFGKVRTLLDDAVVPVGGSASVGSKKGLGDMKALKPNAMAGVPIIWERIQKAIEGQVMKKPWVVQQLFYGSMRLKLELLKLTYGRPNFGTKFLDKTVLKAAREVVGGELSDMLIAGTQSGKDMYKFVFTLFGYPMMGYGLTETVGVGSLSTHAQGYTPGTLGPIALVLELKFMPVVGTVYTGGAEAGGEIWMRGPAVMSGYYKNPTETANVLTPDGWFKTGDIGSLNHLGLLIILDRVKNLVKLSHGEYIALDEVESKYRTMLKGDLKTISILADNGSPFLVAVVEPMDLKEPGKYTERELVEFFKEHAKVHGMNKFETVQEVIICRKDWTLDTNIMTATNKVQKRLVREMFSDRLEAMWGNK